MTRAHLYTLTGVCALPRAFIIVLLIQGSYSPLREFHSLPLVYFTPDDTLLRSLSSARKFEYAAHAPPDFADRSALWNSVEKIEKSKDSQLAREIEIALPVELDREQQIQLVREYVKVNFVSVGMCADFSIHDKQDGNPHAHIMLTMRPLEQSGEWGAKSKKEYLLDKDGQRIKLKNGTFKSRKVDTVDWNSQEKAEVWRQAWADIANRYLAAQAKENQSINPFPSERPEQPPHPFHHRRPFNTRQTPGANL